MINSDKIKGLMREKRITQADVAKALNIAQPTANLKLNNIRGFSLAEANKLAEMLQITDSEFRTYFFCD